MPLTKQEAERVADSLLADADRARENVPVRTVPLIYRSAASRQLDHRQEWLAYKHVLRTPLKNQPALVGIILVYIVAFGSLLFWRGGHGLSGAEYALYIAIMIVPGVAKVTMIRRALARTASERA